MEGGGRRRPVSSFSRRAKAARATSGVVDSGGRVQRGFVPGAGGETERAERRRGGVPGGGVMNFIIGICIVSSLCMARQSVSDGGQASLGF